MRGKLSRMSTTTTKSQKSLLLPASGKEFTPTPSTPNLHDRYYICFVLLLGFFMCANLIMRSVRPTPSKPSLVDWMALRVD
ncbi:hypothetical protein FIBSPDRAFT_558294 [Athelia psychrophila]|uniref:Uncharacterized protein n=1 Tax=Athelia psychrophila TaxID=1759441 RepID=A0A166IF67_9AGAM|nr:hypothetical protein FIBSPDRAFT_558294 [Fibularhizoctonia sp. CBS 109695]